MKFSAKLRKIASLALVFAMIIGLWQITPAGVVNAKAAEGTVDGYTVDTPDATTTYTFSFSDKESEFVKAALTNKAAVGLLSFNAGNKNACSWHSTNYGVEYKEGNMITFKVAGDSYIVVTGDNNSNAPLTATSETGVIKGEATKSSKTSGYCSLDECLAKGSNAVVFEYRGEAGSVTITVGASKAYINSAAIIPILPPTQAGNGKVDVVDFGGNQFKAENYNNLLTAEIANAFAYAGTLKDDKSGVNVQTFTIKDADGKDFVTFNDGGKTNNRYRTTNTDINRYDAKSLTSTVTSVEYKGYIYSNNSSTDTVNMVFNLVANDKVTVAVSSNGNDAHYVFLAPDGSKQEADYVSTTKVSEVTFYAPIDGQYKLYCTNEKMCVARIYREHTLPLVVSGKVEYNDVDKTGSAAPTNYSIAFTNKQTGAVTDVAVKEDGTYKTYLYQPYDYEMSLLDANGYVVNSADPIYSVIKYGDASSDGIIDVTDAVLIKQQIAKIENLDINVKACDVDGDKKVDVTDAVSVMQYIAGIISKFDVDANGRINNIEVKPVKVIEMTGNVKGLSEDALSKLTIEFASDEVYKPEMTVNADGTYVLKVEAGIEYALTAKDVNDYTLSQKTFKAEAAGTADFEFVAKDTYAVTVTLDGIADADAANAVYTFTNVNEKYSDGKTPYKYTFKAGDDIKLRNGQYSVAVAGLGNLTKVQAPTADVKVNDAVGSTTVKFYDLTEWDMAKLGPNSNIETIGENNYFLGLAVAGSVAENKDMYLLVKEGGTVDVPVKAGDQVTIKYCYQAALQIGEKVITSASGSTSKIESTVVTATEDGKLTITGIKTTDEEKNKEVSQTYICGIYVVTPVEYKETISVGADKDYKTIGDALAAVDKMSRPNDERVTIMIEPGNYEEMIVVNAKNVTLKNAAATPSIALKNKGVDIEDGAVRITSYYGHGYSYYSMGTDCKYSADLLAANKANGKESFTNPGSGTTNGSYWNATVVIMADGFAAEDIIFENSFNQYVSAKAAEDVIVKQSGAKEPKDATTRNDLEVGSTAVQDKGFVERAAALAIANNVKNADFAGCKFIGRQDTLYGGTGTTAVFDKCSIYGGTDYIFGGMKAVFYKCDLVANTSNVGTNIANDVFYITAAQTPEGSRGYLMYECNVTSTTPGVDTASTLTSKAGYFGRPWAAGTAEVVFYNTTVQSTNCATDGKELETPTSLIVAAGWNSSLSGESPLCVEYGTNDLAGAKTDGRVSWAPVLSEPVLADGTKISIDAFVDADWLTALRAANRLVETK